MKLNLKQRENFEYWKSWKLEVIASLPKYADCLEFDYHQR